jgi:cell division protein ZapA (FtsZ GTPase activity inhibitor)
LLVEEIVSIELMGESFRFKTDDHHLKTKEITEFFVREVEKVESQFPAHALKTNKLAIVVLASLNISKQYLELVNHYSDALNSVASRTARLDNMIGLRRTG